MLKIFWTVLLLSLSMASAAFAPHTIRPPSVHTEAEPPAPEDFPDAWFLFRFTECNLSPLEIYSKFSFQRLHKEGSDDPIRVMTLVLVGSDVLSYMTIDYDQERIPRAGHAYEHIGKRWLKSTAVGSRETEQLMERDIQVRKFTPEEDSYCNKTRRFRKMW